jgi:hypothetical protein
MLVIRNVFRCKPGQAKNLVKILKETITKAQSEGIMREARVMTDIASTFWTVVFEMQTESLEVWEREMQPRAGARSAMEGYMDLVDGGHREIFKVE